MMTDPVRERNDTLALLDAAVIPLRQSLNIRLIPPEGASFGYAMRGARDKSSVAAVKGGIQDENGAPRPFGPSEFATDDPVVRAILTVMKFEPAVRSAAILRFLPRALSVLEDDMFLECASYQGGPKRPGISTMDWGIAFCCKEDIPDVIFEKTPDPDQSRFIFLGEDPSDVANNIIICSGRI
ncbi:MAG: phosphomethylpyrimidine kinase [Methanomicrobiales archaeon]|nr:phosphomethylpyrimidine kinase [Methanomicrobiales archaeon]